MAKTISQHILNSDKAIQEGTPMFDKSTNEVFLYTHTEDKDRKIMVSATPKQAQALNDSRKCIITL